MKDTTSIIDDTTRRHIKSLKRHVTVLFTDIVDSTKYWDKFGDVQGRLMVDRHNRLLFPLVAKFKGKIVKTIGDSIMAVFVKPEHAVKAAIAMQQSIASERQGDDTFRINIRIGVHTGDAIVEKGDVYGDIVNVAARVESVGKADEILVSQTTIAYIDDQYAFNFRKKGWFVPKGKKHKLHVHQCDWQHHPSLIDNGNASKALPISGRQKLVFASYFLINLAVLYFIYHNYLRYYLVDSDQLATIYLNLSTIMQNYPYISGLVGITLLIHLILLLRARVLPLTLFRITKGGFLFSVSFIIIYLIANFIPVNFESKWNEILDSSGHSYVKILEENSPIFSEPSLQATPLQNISAGHVLLQKENLEKDNLNWNKVLLANNQHGWVVQVSPPQMGVPEKIVSQAFQVHFRYKDLYIFTFGVLCFIFGVWKFRIRPI